MKSSKFAKVHSVFFPVDMSSELGCDKGAPYLLPDPPSSFKQACDSVMKLNICHFYKNHVSCCFWVQGHTSSSLKVIRVGAH